MKKILNILLILLFCGITTAYADDIYTEYIPSDNVVLYSKSSKSINCIDPNSENCAKYTSFPGFRGANQLVVYTSEYGKRTNTNEFGAEAIVKGNTVVSISGADSLIPEDGIVISGHGSAKTWINKNIMVGSKIYIDKDKNSITVYNTSDSYIYSAKECLNEVEKIMNYYVQSDKYYNNKKILECIKSSKNCIKKAESHPKKVQEYSQLAIDYANKALYQTIPYKESELKGVWLRPTCRNKEEVVQLVSKIAEAGLNNVFIETFYHGMTIFPSKTMAKYGFTEQNPIYEDFDILKCFIEECHKHNIKVNIWFESFYIGNKKPESNKTSILAVCPSWSNLTKKNYNSEKPIYCSSEHNGYFLDPANPEVQTFLAQLICEIIYTYQPDGINIDYIRYPQSNIPKTKGSELGTWGYTQYARNEFIESCETDPIELTPEDELWTNWCDYRRYKVTEFVRRVSKICKSNNVTLTAVIFPNRYVAMNNKLQDWKTWSDANLIDGFTPLFLTCDYSAAADLMKGVIKNKKSNTKLYAGLFVTFMSGSESDLIRQIHEARKLNLDGFSIFDYAHLPDRYVYALKESVTNPTKQQQNKTKQKIKTRKRVKR